MRPVARLLIASYCILAYAETRHGLRSTPTSPSSWNSEYPKRSSADKNACGSSLAYVRSKEVWINSYDVQPRLTAG